MTNMYLSSFLFNFSNKKFIAAVSGGSDSMGMLNKYKKKIKAVAFVNYGERNDNWYDEKIIKEFCDKNKILLFVHKVDWTKEKICNDNWVKFSLNSQSYARKLRYDFFYELSEKIQNKNLLIAHNFNDFLETGYAQILKNSASLFYGILKNSNYKNLKIFRPLLYVKKKDIEQYCKKHNVIYNVDYTNESDIYERNRNRKIILDMSKIEYKKLIKKIFSYNKQNSKKLKEVNFFYLKWYNSKFDINIFHNIPEYQKENVIYLLLIHNNWGKISKDKIKGIVGFLSKKNNKEFRVSFGINIVIKKGFLKW